MSHNSHIDIYLTNNPISLLKEVKDIANMYLDRTINFPDSNRLISSSDGINPDTLSIAGAVIYHKANKSLDPFLLINTGDSEYTSISLKDEYSYLSFKAQLIDELYEGIGYETIAQFIFLHTVIKIDALPLEMILDEDLGIDGWTEVEFPLANPYHHFSDLLMYTLDDFKNEPTMKTFPEFIRRVDRLIELLQNYCIYCPS